MCPGQVEASSGSRPLGSFLPLEAFVRWTGRSRDEEPPPRSLPREIPEATPPLANRSKGHRRRAAENRPLFHLPDRIPVDIAWELVAIGSVGGRVDGIHGSPPPPTQHSPVFVISDDPIEFLGFIEYSVKRDGLTHHNKLIQCKEL